MTAIRGLNMNISIKPKTNAKEAVKTASLQTGSSSKLSQSVSSSNAKYGKAAKTGNTIGLHNSVHFVSANRHNRTASYSSGNHYSSRSGETMGFRAWNRSSMIAERNYMQQQNMRYANANDVFAAKGLSSSQMATTTSNAAGVAGAVTTGVNIFDQISSLVSAFSSKSTTTPSTTNTTTTNTNTGNTSASAAISTAISALSGNSSSSTSSSISSILSEMRGASDSKTLRNSIETAKNKLTSMGDVNQAQSNAQSTVEQSERNVETAKTNKSEKKQLHGQAQQKTKSMSTILENAKLKLQETPETISDGNGGTKHNDKYDTAKAEVEKAQRNYDEAKKAEEDALNEYNDASTNYDNAQKQLETDKDALKTAKQNVSDHKELSSAIDKANKELDKLVKKESEKLDDINKKEKKNIDKTDDAIDDGKLNKANRLIKKTNKLEEKEVKYADLSDETYVSKNCNVKTGLWKGFNSQTNNEVYANNGKRITKEQYEELSNKS